MKFYTIGYGGRALDDFKDILEQRKIKILVDVRLRPDKASMGAYVKAKSPQKGIQRLLTQVGIEYLSLIELGNIFLDYEDWAKRYQELMNRAGDLLTERLRRVKETFCLMCAEKRVEECHRQIISEYLVGKGYEVEHIE